MKTTTTINTSVVVELNAQDILAYVIERGLAPKEWVFFSVEVKGRGVSEGATLTLNHSVTKEAK